MVVLYAFCLLCCVRVVFSCKALYMAVYMAGPIAPTLRPKTSSAPLEVGVIARHMFYVVGGLALFLLAMFAAVQVAFMGA